jgi:hypothetical protein
MSKFLDDQLFEALEQCTKNEPDAADFLLVKMNLFMDIRGFQSLTPFH